jgi:peptidoglycan hydrolase CwlO-like protein
MKNRKFWVSVMAGILAGVMILSLIFSILPMPVDAKTSDEIRDEIDQLEDEQLDIWMQMDELEAQQSDNWDTIEDMVAQKDNIDQQINLLNTEIQNINEQIRNYALLIAENQKELDQAEAVLEDLSEKNKERIRAMEEEGKMSYWSVLFKASSFIDLLDRLNMIEEIQAADERRLEELAQAADKVAEARTTLEQEKGELEGSRLELAEAQKVLHLLQRLLRIRVELHCVREAHLHSSGVLHD